MIHSATQKTAMEDGEHWRTERRATEVDVEVFEEQGNENSNQRIEVLTEESDHWSPTRASAGTSNAFNLQQQHDGGSKLSHKFAC